MMKPTSQPANGTSHSKLAVVTPSSVAKTEDKKTTYLSVKSRSTTAIPYKQSQPNKKISLVDVSKSVSTSALKSENCSTPRSDNSPSLASLSTTVFSAGSTSGVTPMSSAVTSETDPLKNAAPSVDDLPTPIVRSASRQKFQATVRNSIRKV